MKVRLHEGARADLIAAAEWYLKQKPGLEIDFIDELVLDLRLLSETPTAWPLWPYLSPDLGVRRFVVGRFPYVIAYRVTADIIVLAIAHARREPLYWLDRV